MNAKTRFVLATLILFLLMAGPFLVTTVVVYADLSDEGKQVFLSVMDRWLPIGGMMTFATSEVMMAPNAAPIMIPTAMSTTLPRITNALNSLNILLASHQIYFHMFHHHHHIKL